MPEMEECCYIRCNFCSRSERTPFPVCACELTGRRGKELLRCLLCYTRRGSPDITLRKECVKMKGFSNQREKTRYFHSLSGERKTEAFCEMLEESEMTVFLGGAGVSTESGIPDFRSKNGLYRKSGRLFSRYKPEYLLSSKCLSDRPGRGRQIWYFMRVSGRFFGKFTDKACGVL